MAFFLAGILSGCATQQNIAFPEYKSTATISVSTDTLSTSTETPAGDYLIPNSQVFIGGAGKATGSVAGNMFGVLGALVSIELDKSKNESSLGEHSKDLQVKFNGQVSDNIAKIIDANPLAKSKFAMLSPGDDSDLKVLPSVRFDVKGDSVAVPYFQMDIRFKELDSGKQVRRTYSYYGDEQRPFSQWAENSSAIFNQSSQKSFQRLSQAFIDDLLMLFKDKITKENIKVIKLKTKDKQQQIFSNAVLREYSDYLVLAPVANDEVIPNHIIVLDRNFISIE